MFSALNRFMSRLDGEQPTQQSRDESFGFQVLRNTNMELQIEPWFDYIIGINGRPLDNSNPALFAQEVRNCAGGSLSLALWSAKGQRTREMHIPIPADSASLGVSLQWTPLALAANVWHVLDVAANSPADQAGLLPYSDYILGSPEGALHGESGLSELVDDHIGRPLRIYVYNNEYDVTREVTIQPSREWGGEGALGCVLGYGALHRLPAPLNEPVSAPGETLFDGDRDPTTGAVPYGAGAAPSPLAAGAGQPDTSNSFVPATGGATSADFLVPAQMEGAPPISAPIRGKKKKERSGQSPNKTLMDDYFKEEEEKSRGLDGPGEKAKGVAPPPKAGGPPPTDSTGPPK